LIWLDDESDIEDILMRSWLTESGKEEVREIISNRKTSRQKITNWVIKSVIEKVKEKYFKT
jgi:hypothetical protein